MTNQSSIEAKIIEFSDRLGQKANTQDDWFEKVVETWRLRDGRRLPAMELNQLGQQVLVWASGSRTDVARSVMDELELALTDNVLPHADAWTFAHEMLDGLLVALNDWRETHESNAPEIEELLRNLMGDETKMIWVPMVSRAF